MGVRLGQALPKALAPIKGEPLLVHTLRRFEAAGILDGAVIVFPEGYHDEYSRLIRNFFAAHLVILVKGGDSRQASVALGLEAMDTATEIAVIHDAARPFVSTSVIQASIDAAAQHGAATVAIPAVDTILESTPDSFLERTPDRSALWACQTPQSFQLDIIKAAHAHALTHALTVTDDATLVHQTGTAVKLVAGEQINLKVTNPTDLLLAEIIIEKGLL